MAGAKPAAGEAVPIPESCECIEVGPRITVRLGRRGGSRRFVVLKTRVSDATGKALTIGA